MIYLDLFSGIGGFHKGLVDAGIKVDKCYFSEIDKYATQVYQKHFPETIPLGDVSRIDGTKLGQINLITFGFPCQDLSIAGKRKGLQGSRSGLFFQATRIIRECKPDTFIFENVKGLLSSNNGQDFETVLREIADIGLYECEWQLLNTSWFLPQNRESIYFVGHFERTDKTIFPLFADDKNCKTRNTETSGRTICNRLTTRSAGGGNCRGNYKKYGETLYRLTPIECERLQGFPDGWTSGLSDTQRYKCLGNAVSVPVVKEIMTRLFRHD